MTPYSEYTILGPYTRPDSRQIVITINVDGGRSTVSYPKYLMEITLGRRLEFNEIVHHKDEDVFNNALDNLEIITRTQHGSMHGVKYKEIAIGNCVWCGTEISLSIERQRSLTRDKNRGKAGPFCSKVCIGKYGKGFQ